MMRSTAKVKSMTLRLPLALYEAGSRLAKRRRVSLNQLVREGLEATLGAEQEKALYDAFTEVGRDTDESDVSYAVSAQEEVMTRDER